MNAPPTARTLVLACGALAKELGAIIDLNDLGEVSVECLPASLHNRPGDIPAALMARLDRVRDDFDRILVGYGDCGTAGEIDKICEAEGIERLPGAHCYQFFAGSDRFADMHDADPTALYLTDYLAKHFERLIMKGLGLIDHPELRDMYFGNYTKVIYLAQTNNDDIDRLAEQAATTLGLGYERIFTGYGELAEATVAISRSCNAVSDTTLQLST